MNMPYLPQIDNEPDPDFKSWLVKLIVSLGILFCIILAFATIVRGEVVDVEKLATAIYYAEGGEKTNFPYGILAKYKTTTPRQACINTINHALRDWDSKGDFIVFLGSRYCPVGAKNDPTGLNKNWVKNVKRLLKKQNA